MSYQYAGLFLQPIGTIWIVLCHISLIL